MKVSLFKKGLVLAISVVLAQGSHLSYATAAANPTDPWGTGSGGGTGNGPWNPPTGGGGQPTDPNWPVPPPGGGTDPSSPTDPSTPIIIPQVPTQQDPISSNQTSGWPSGGTGGFGGGYGNYYCSSTSTSSWGGGGGFGGGWGGFGGGYTNPPGTPAQVDRNGRPIIGMSCSVPPEYDCPLFENRPHDGLNQALDSLAYAMATEPECQQQQNSISYVQQNTQAIQQVLGNLQQYMDNPQLAKADMATFERSITAAIQAAGNLGTLFSSNSLVNSSCGKEVMSSGKVLLAINDILNGLAPYALMATSINPAIGGTAAFAITGGAMATSAISSIVRMIEQGTVDMTNPEHRKAVLRNTCQYTKIAKKIRFMQLAQSGRIHELTQELDKQMIVYRARFQQPSKNLQAALDWGNQVSTQQGNYDVQIRRDEFELSALEMQMKESANDDLYTCLIANEMVRRTNFVNYNSGFQQTNQMNLTSVFPASVFSNLESIYAMRTNSGNGNDAQIPGSGNGGNGTINDGDWFTPSPTPPTPTPYPTNQTPIPPSSGEDDGSYDFQITSIKMLNDVSRKRVMALEQKVLAGDEVAVQSCAQTTRSWVKGMRQALTLSRTLLNAEALKLNNLLLENPEYASWKKQSDTIKAEEATVSRVARVMKELAKDTSVIDRSELDQKKTLIKGALFGNRGSWKWGRAPIEEWLEHTMRLHGNRISSMNQNIESLQMAAFQLTITHNLDRQMMMQMAARQDYKLAASRSVKAANLETITIDRVQPGTRGHEIACQLMETTWLDWAASIDHLGATEFMCDLIDDQIDNKVDKGIVKFCRGTIGLDSRQITLSKIQEAKKKITEKIRYGTFDSGDYGDMSASQKTYRDWALLVAQKMNDLQCPLPPVSVMKGN